MSAMDVDTTTPNDTPGSRRKSGRTVRQPAVFSQERHAGSVLINGVHKRKHPEDAPEELEDDDEEIGSEDDDDDDNDDEPGEEELRAQRRAKRAARPSTKPAQKRAKTTAGPSTTLAIRSANIQGKTKTAGKSAKNQKARTRPSQAHEQGLYAEVFGRGQSAEDAASKWFESARSDSVAALTDLVNFILQCIGCDSKVENQDIEDLDAVPNKLAEVLQEYDQQKVVDYPLISKQKQYAGFQDVLEDFFTAVIMILDSSGAFYELPEIYDNIHVWVATMSSANYKSFRHTATVISLTMSTALCRVAKGLQQTMANLKAQMDAEKKPKSGNKGRIKTIETSQKAAEKKLEAIDVQLRDAFDTVYVHRYRDVEERIRAPCVAALGEWILLYRKVFLDGIYLRYLGWVLSDTSAPTRLEDIKQLQRLFNDKNNIPALRAFTDRFRTRLVEMGARDADINVRAEAIELLDKLRDAELLEPDDIDTIGRLIFDTEPRIRKAVARFFVSNVEDLYAVTTEDFDKAQYQEVLPKKGVNDVMVPARSWIRFKCLGAVFAGYDNDEESLDGAPQSLPLNSIADSRYTLATQAIFPYMADLQNWEALAGYLLYDHSSIPSTGDDEDVEFLVQQAYKLSLGEEVILLDVLHAAVKSHLQLVMEPQANRKANSKKDKAKQRQEATAQHLTEYLPKLLNKFGSTPRAASSILRIEQLLDIGLINDFQSGDATYAAILDDISKQFTTHSDKEVLAAASAALRNARNYEQSREAADAKMEEIWSDSVSTLADLLHEKAVGSRGTLDKHALVEVVHTIVRLAELAGVYDCSHILESRMTPKASKRQKARSNKQQTLLDLLVQLLQRGEADEDTTFAFAELEDQLCMAVIELFSLYFRWKVFGLRQAISSKDQSQLSAAKLTELAVMRTSFVEAAAPIIQSRTPLDPVRYRAILTVLELFALFTTIRFMRPEKGDLDEETETNLQSLLARIPEDVIKEVLLSFEKVEKSFARKTRRKIETVVSKDKKGAKGKKTRQDEEQTQEEIEKPPEDSDDEAEHGSDVEADDDDDDDEAETEEGKKSKNAKRQAALLAEQNLCELTSKIIFAIAGGAIENAGEVKERLMLNKGKLGKNYTALLTYLEEKKKAPSKKRPAADKTVDKAQKGKGKKKVVSEEMVLDDDDIEDSQMGDDPDRPEEEDIDEEEAQRRRELLEDENADGDQAQRDSDGEGEMAGDVEDDEIMGD
jgi:cohesin complex subunit SA-1/2